MPYLLIQCLQNYCRYFLKDQTNFRSCFRYLGHLHLVMVKVLDLVVVDLVMHFFDHLDFLLDRHAIHEHHHRLQFINEDVLDSSLVRIIHLRQRCMVICCYLYIRILIYIMNLYNVIFITLCYLYHYTDFINIHLVYQMNSTSTFQDRYLEMDHRLSFNRYLLIFLLLGLIYLLIQKYLKHFRYRQKLYHQV